MIIIGIDENGLGPVLGPMVVTACAFRAEDYDVDAFWSLSDSALPADDSKIVFKQNRKATAEAAVLKWLRLFSVTPDSTDKLYTRICRPMDTPCPPQRHSVCRPLSIFSIPFFGTASATIGDDILKRFSTANIVPLDCAAFAVCPGTYNHLLSGDSLNKLQLDFKLMVQLISHIRSLHPNEPILALCGKVGGTRCYIPWFESSGMDNITVISERREESRYSVDDNLEIAFIKDGDGLHLPIAVASMVGKYVRELQMVETNELLAPGEKHISGYRDPRTKTFIVQTVRMRTALGLPDRCFLRNS